MFKRFIDTAIQSTESNTLAKLTSCYGKGFVLASLNLSTYFDDFSEEELSYSKIKSIAEDVITNKCSFFKHVELSEKYFFDKQFNDGFDEFVHMFISVVDREIIFRRGA